MIRVNYSTVKLFSQVHSDRDLSSAVSSIGIDVFLSAIETRDIDLPFA